ncbi:MAG: wax ester/triacylglycerol synthase family O-acyltransferase [Myxococcota bacterium]
MAQPLDRRRPLWETWIVEGLGGGDQFAMITKIHHCMIDGASGVDLAQVLFTPRRRPRARRARAVRRAPAPRRLELWLDETKRHVGTPVAVARDVRRFAETTEDLREEVGTRFRAVSRLLGMGMNADPTPLNGRVGPHRPSNGSPVASMT